MLAADGSEVAIVRRSELAHDGGKYVETPLASMRLVLTENINRLGDEGSWACATLTADEARQLAKQLNDMADDIDYEQSKEQGR